MRNFVSLLLAALYLAAICGQRSEAAIPVVALKSQMTVNNRSATNNHLELDMPVQGPFAYTHFCLRYEDDCRIHNFQFRRPRPIVMTAQRHRDLLEINAQINRLIRPKRYVNDTTFDTWRINPRSGDCNDFAVSKRHELLARGWPSRALLLSEVVTPWGEHHLILLVRTQHEDLVLDNLNANIKPWSSTRYSWVRVQSPVEPALWSTVKSGSLS